MARDEELDDDLEFDSPRPARRRRGAIEPPSFVTTMSIVDLVMCCLRLLAAGVGVVGLLAVASQGVVGLGLTVYADAGINLLLGIVGIVAAILLLRKSPIAVPLGWATVGLAILSVLLAVVSVINLVSNADAGFGGQPRPPGFVPGAIIGAAVTVGIRLVLLGMYATALVKFSEWLANRR